MRILISIIITESFVIYILAERAVQDIKPYATSACSRNWWHHSVSVSESIDISLSELSLLSDPGIFGQMFHPCTAGSDPVHRRDTSGTSSSPSRPKETRSGSDDKWPHCLRNSAAAGEHRASQRADRSGSRESVLVPPTFQNLYVIQKMGAEKMQWAQHFIDRGFQGWQVSSTSSRSRWSVTLSHLSPPALEPILKETSGTYCVEDEVRVTCRSTIPQHYDT